jgi:hypothetical protein
MKVIEGKGDEGDTLRARTIYVYDTAQVSFASIFGLCAFIIGLFCPHSFLSTWAS